MHEHHDDDALRALLQSATPAPPVDDVDWQRLHARITAGATPLLRARTQSWWGLVASWSGRAGSAAAAAAAALLLLLSQVSRPAPAGNEFFTVEEVLAEAMLAEAGPILAPTNDDMVEALLLEGSESQ